MKKCLTGLMAMTMIALSVACTGRKVYDTYAHTPTTGWEKNDTLVFSVPSMTAAGSYDTNLGLRITEGYPFTAVSLIVEQRVLPSDEVFTDTLNCVLVGKDGNMSGQGVSYHQYIFPVRTLSLADGDSLQISVRHDMKREILPGISDLGIEISRH